MGAGSTATTGGSTTGDNACEMEPFTYADKKMSGTELGRVWNFHDKGNIRTGTVVSWVEVWKRLGLACNARHRDRGKKLDNWLLI